MSFVLDTTQLQELQDVYAQVANLFIFCVDENGKRITEMSGNPEEISRVVALLDELQIRAAIKSGIREINFGTDVCCSMLNALRAVDEKLIAIDLVMKEPTEAVKRFCLEKIRLLGAEGTNE